MSAEPTAHPPATIRARGHTEEAVADDQWQRNAGARATFVEEVGLLTSGEVERLSKRALPELANGHLLTIDDGQGKQYPAFQFDQSGQPLPQVAEALARLPRGLQGWSLALWWTTPTDALDGERPLDVLHDLHRLQNAAQAKHQEWQFAAGTDTEAPADVTSPTPNPCKP